MYEKWVKNLLKKINTNQIIVNNNLNLEEYVPDLLDKEESNKNNIGIIVQNKNFEKKFLVIDSSSIKPFYDKIAEPTFSYEKSLNFASNNCLNYILEWLG